MSILLYSPRPFQSLYLCGTCLPCSLLVLETSIFPGLGSGSLPEGSSVLKFQQVQCTDIPLTVAS